MVRRQSPDRMTTNTNRPRSSVAVVNVTGAAVVAVPPVSARTVAPRIVDPVSSRTTPPIRFCARSGVDTASAIAAANAHFEEEHRREYKPDVVNLQCASFRQSASAACCAASRGENPQCAGLSPRSSSCDQSARMRPIEVAPAAEQQVANLMGDRAPQQRCHRRRRPLRDRANGKHVNGHQDAAALPRDRAWIRRAPPGARRRPACGRRASASGLAPAAGVRCMLRPSSLPGTRQSIHTREMPALRKI